MQRSRLFRFGVMAPDLDSKEAWAEQARKVEALGYSTIGIGEHLIFGGPSPIPALMAAADATTTLRVSTQILINDYRHPAVMANEIATLDRLSGGRVELGLGAGLVAQDFTMIGLPFDPPATRVRRLGESVRLVKQLLGDHTVTFNGEFYQVDELNIHPKPLQRPHPPIYVAGGGKGILSLAAREADIVGLHSKAMPSGGHDMSTRTAAAFDQKARWVREAAGDRYDDLELNVHIILLEVSEHPRQAAEAMIARFAELPPGVASNVPRTIEEVLEAPYCLAGTAEQIVETLHDRRERYGISYITIHPRAMEMFSPIVARLAGT